MELDVTFMTNAVETIPKEFKDQATLYRSVMMTYYAAIREVQTKLEILNDDLQVRTSRNPIEFIKVRLKSPESILNKMQRYCLDKTIQNLSKINDIAGVRVICTYINDIYDVANMLVNQDDVKLVQIKDYIKKPKSNGYRSLHLVIEVPVFFSNEKRQMKVEVQIRTIAMDFWSTIEHDVEYKHIISANDDIKAELKECATISHDLDLRMQEIKTKLKGIRDETIQRNQN